MPDSLWPHGLQHPRLPCPSLSPGVCSNACLLSRWCHPTISSSAAPISFCLQSFPASLSFPKSWLFTSGGECIRASASVLLMNIRGWFALGLTGLFSLLSKALSRVFSSAIIRIVGCPKFKYLIERKPLSNLPRVTKLIAREAQTWMCICSIKQSVPYSFLVLCMAQLRAEPVFSIYSPAPHFKDPLQVPGAKLCNLHYPGSPSLTSSWVLPVGVISRREEGGNKRGRYRWAKLLLCGHGPAVAAYSRWSLLFSGPSPSTAGLVGLQWCFFQV